MGYAGATEPVVVHEWVDAEQVHVDRCPPALYRQLGASVARLEHFGSYACRNVYNRDDHPWLTSLGLYDSSVDQAAEDLYLQAARTDYLPRFKSTLEQRLQGLTDLELALMNQIETYFTSRGLQVSPSNRRQAHIPDGAIPIENPVGTAPGYSAGART